MKLIIGGSLFFSILQSVLLWKKLPGISVILFIIPLLLFFIFFLNKNKKIQNRRGLIWGLPIIALGFTYFIFNNGMFNFFNMFAIGILWLIMCISLTGTNLRIKELLYLIGGAFKHIGTVMRGVLNIFKKDDNKEETKESNGIAKAVILTLPITLIVIILLASADGIFSNLFRGVGDILNILIGNESILETIGRTIVIIITFIYMAGFLCNIIKRKIEDQNIQRKAKTIDTLTTEIMITILNGVYIIFCIIQILYLFTKAGMPDGMTYAEYARQGFFQLMIVTFINFGILLWIHAKEKNQLDEKQCKYIKLMEMVMEICTQVIIISAFYRMFLYEQAYGYTYLRLFVYFILFAEFAFMIFVLIYTTGKKINLMKAGLIIGTVTYLALNYINVDKVIAKKNIDRYFASPQTEIDFYYLRHNTGTDAISEIKRLLNTDDEKLKNIVNIYLWTNKMFLKQEETWLEFNISREYARYCLEDINREGV